MKTIAVFLFFVSGLAKAATESQISALVDELVKSDVVLIGETHPNPVNSSFFTRFLENMERRHPGRVGLVSLETYTYYQKDIDRFMRTGDSNILLGSRDHDILRGHHGDVVIKRNFLGIFETLFSLKSRRTFRPLEVLAMDQLPDDSMSLSEWKRTHSELDMLLWAASRDEGMASRITRRIKKLKMRGQMAVVFVGNFHLMGHALMEARADQLGLKLPVSWLARRMRESVPGVRSVLQSNSHSQIVDAIERGLRGARETQIIDLSRSVWGEMHQKDFYLSTDLPPLVKLRFLPEDSRVRDNYDYYVYHPLTLSYTKASTEKE